ncbi:tetratricopeptide repeat protein [Paucidesulfovibrio longus]|uniref:tetratricopeptide repeat protein n=1 Tax=Paucidesulfovibrio longus TaxID=889 RepID=UPI0003B34B0D|nr:tetratricopeptide repeat protein [Paucidesulfovibrio longus]
MQQKIEWFQEVLSLEPGSRVFFPLARLFVQVGELENAVSTLRSGLDRHPEYLEARMLLVQVLSDLGRSDEALEQSRRVVEALGGYPSFWKLWAQGQPHENRDFAVFLMLVASWLQGRPVHWTDIMLEGVNSLSDKLVGPLPEPAPRLEPTEPQRRSVVVEGAVTRKTEGAGGSLRTKTMADLLAAQGDYQGAQDIYRELWSRATGADKDELAGRIREMEAGIVERQSSPQQEPDPDEDVFSQHAKNRLIGALEMLAARFEARVRRQNAD